MIDTLYPDSAPPFQLNIGQLLQRSRTWCPDQVIRYRDQMTLTYADLHQRINRLANLLQALGVKPGDRVGVMDFDSHRYLELYFAVPMVGAVLHTVNIRLNPAQVGYTVAHAEDTVLFMHQETVPLLQALSDYRDQLRAIVIMEGDADNLPEGAAGNYETLLEAQPGDFDFPELDENTVASLFYTTGTTGEPKGVYFTHRQLVLHTLANGYGLAAYPRPLSFTATDVYMPLTPMFHVHAWGVPYIATLLGIKQVYPGKYEPRMLLQLLKSEQVTFSHCVPTILQMILQGARSAGITFEGWKVIIGGGALSPALAGQARDLGIDIVGGYGQSETCPVVSVSQFKPHQEEPEEPTDLLTRTGFPMPLVDVRIWDEQNQPLPPGQSNTGEIVLRAPWLTAGYFKNPDGSRKLWEGGWLHTGDMAYQDDEGYLKITDRLKDIIKVGGEWLPSVQLENYISAHSDVSSVACIGTPHEKWGEIPLAVLTLDGENPPDEDTVLSGIRELLKAEIDRGRLSRQALLTRIQIVDKLPYTSVGKVDKKALRQEINLQTDENRS